MTKSVVVVGGGTAGWMTATYLRATFGPRVAVTVVESDRIPTIGVGEATFSTVRHFFRHLGLAEHEWMPECDATYKLAIRFENWRAPGHHFYHPFERQRVVDGFPLPDWWLALRPGERFDDDCFVIPALCEAKRSPRRHDGRLFDSRLDDADAAQAPTQFPYAYHFDAALLARFLTRHGVERGVRHVVDDVTDVVVDERGWISHLRTAGSGDVHGDLFVDCTGFRSMLLGGALGEPFVSYKDVLPNDRAVALRVPSDPAADGLRPCTTASAQEAGWIWTIPLSGRIGAGYVYSGDHITPDQAEATLRRVVGPAADGLEANHIRMRIGRSRRAWVANCVGIGLSAGFVEPLESTGIFFIQQGVELLAEHLPGADADERLRASYNDRVAHMLDGVREFLALHYYAAARRNNDYWRETKERPLPGDLAARVEHWQARLPDAESVYPYFHGFEPYSYSAMLLGLGGVPLRATPALSLLDDGAATKEFALLREEARGLVDRLPGQYEYLQARAAAGGARRPA